MKNIRKIMKEIIVFFFASRKNRGIFDLFTEDIYICGLSNDATIENKAQLLAYFRGTLEKDLSQNTLIFRNEKEIDNHTAIIDFVVESQGIPVLCRVLGICKEDSYSRQMSIMNFSVIHACSTNDKKERAQQITENGEQDRVIGGFVGEEKAKLEAAVEAAEAATKAKTEFLSRMSHEIRTPMNAIMGMTAIAKQNKFDFLQVADCLDKIDLSAHFMLTLLNDILEMSRIESGKTTISIEPFDFNQLNEGIRTIAEALATQSDIWYECINEVDSNYIYIGDRVRIQQFLVNIITNGIKFTKPGGRVRFTIKSNAIDDQHVTMHFIVQDTGIGMSPSFMDNMFKPFSQEDGSNTSKYQGTGLGLAISKNLIDLMDGQIYVDSIVGIGTTFHVYIPLERMKKSTTYSVRNAKGSTPLVNVEVLKGSRILVAEDHPMNVIITKKLLEAKGVHVTVAENGEMAVNVFSASKESFYDAILMDIRMPLLDGIEATRIIRHLERDDAYTVPIIAMTANALDEDRERTQAAGMNAHLAKPFEPKELYAVLAQVITTNKKE